MNTHQQQRRALIEHLTNVLVTTIGANTGPASCFTLEESTSRSPLGVAMGLCLKNPSAPNAAKIALHETRNYFSDYRSTFKLKAVVGTQVQALGRLTVKLENLITGDAPLPDLVVIDFVTTRAKHSKGFGTRSNSNPLPEGEPDNESLQGLTGVLIACHLRSRDLPKGAKSQLKSLRTALLAMNSEAPYPFSKS